MELPAGLEPLWAGLLLQRKETWTKSLTPLWCNALGMEILLGGQTLFAEFRLLYERTARRKRRQIGPSVVAQLKDKAWTITQEIDHHKLTRRDGAVYLLEFLRDRLGRSPVPDVGIRLEELMIKLRRTPGTSMSSWATQVRQTYKRVQIALHRARVEKKGPQAVGSPSGENKDKKASSSPSSPSNTSRRGPPSPARRASEATQGTQENPRRAPG